MCSGDIFLGLLAVLFPPLAVWVKRGVCGADSLINILLCVLGYIPGLLHAWYIIAKFPEPPYEYEALSHDGDGDRVTYVYVQTPHGPHCQQPKPVTPHAGMGYGTQAAAQQKQQQQAQHASQDHGEGSSDNQGVPPSYADVVAGDHKIQMRD